jgi:hypothetical protein
MDPPLAVAAKKPNPNTDAQCQSDELTETISVCGKRRNVFTNKQDMCRGNSRPKRLGVMLYLKTSPIFRRGQSP